jgi:hypothetical protein
VSTPLERLFRTPPADAGLLPAAPRGKEAADALATEMLYEFRLLRETMTQTMGRLAGQIVNDVLSVRTVTFDATGFTQLGPFHVAAGSIFVDNLSAANTVTVTSHGPSPDGAAPAAGLGVSKVKAGQGRTINVASHNITLYGTNGDSVSVQVSTAAARPFAGV